MAFEFKKKESVRKAVKRLGRRRIEKALRDLDHCDRLEAVHEVRKKIKELRALLRLLRPAMTRSDYRSCSKPLRKAAGYLSAARDAQVKVNALERLTRQQGLAPRCFRQFKGMLRGECRQQQGELSQSRTRRSVGRLLNKLRDEFPAIRLKHSGWRALSSGIRHSYREGRCRYQLARKNRGPEQLHEWRKRVKDLYYQIGLLCPVRSQQIEGAVAELDRLGERLGDYHDLVLISEACATKHLWKQALEEAKALKPLVAEQQKELRTRALALGASFYEEKPSAFCKRLGQYWKRWRREPKHLARSA
jgi:CHAD domain-containing protein